MQFFIIPALIAGLHVIFVWATAWRKGHAARISKSAPLPPPAPLPMVSVLVPAWREQATITGCIAALGAVRYPHWEAIIIAGGPDGTYQSALMACHNLANMQVIEQTPRGKNAALNDGLRLAQGTVIVLLDADTQVDPGWLMALINALSPPVGAVCGQPLARQRTAIARHEELEQLVTWQVHGEFMLQGSGSIAVHRGLLDALGGFPETVTVGVDWDLGARLVAHGVVLAQAPAAVVRTERPATLSEYWHNELRWRRAHLGWLLRQPERPRALGVVLRSFYIYGLAWAGLVSLLLLGALALGQSPATLPTLAIASLVAAWVLLRSVAVIFAAMAYSADWRWLRLAWTPPLALLCTCAAIIIATLTVRRDQTHFKGPRPGKEQYGS